MFTVSDKFELIFPLRHRVGWQVLNFRWDPILARSWGVRDPLLSTLTGPEHKLGAVLHLLFPNLVLAGAWGLVPVGTLISRSLAGHGIRGSLLLNRLIFLLILAWPRVVGSLIIL